MDIDIINPHVMKILISARNEDSISSISKRINLSYGWTNKWINELIKKGIFKKKWRGIILNEKSKPYQKIIKFIKENFNDISFYYSVLSLFGVKYCFTKIDSVYIWTEGRYNIARYRDYYPIFIKIKKSDCNIFLGYCKKLGLKTNSKKGVFYAPEVLEEFKCVKKNTFFVDSLDETVGFMQKNIYNFEPALEIINEMYNKKLDIKYKEINLLR